LILWGCFDAASQSYRLPEVKRRHHLGQGIGTLEISSFVIREIDEDLSRKGAKAQSAAAFPTVFFAPLRLCAFAGKIFSLTESESMSYLDIPVDSNQDLLKGY